MKRDEWETVRLGDVCDISAGGTPSRNQREYWEDGTIPWVKISDITGKYLSSTEERITQLGLDNSSAKIFSKGTVLYTIFATIGDVCILDIDAATNQAIVGMTFNKSYDKDYVYYLLSSLKEKYEQISRGIAQKNINQSILKNTEIPLPPLDVQRRIAETLDKVTELISLRKTQLGKLDELVKARFVEMFGDPNLNDKGWVLLVINDIGTCVAGATPSTNVKEYWENGTIPWMSSGEVNKGRIFETDTKITQLGYDNTSTKLVPPRTVVLAMAGQGKTRGTVALTEIELCTNQSICSIVNNEKINVAYLLYFLKMQYKELRRASTNTDGRGGLNLKIIGNYPIMLPPIGLQNQFAAFVEQTDKAKAPIQQSLDTLETLKKSLMQEYFGLGPESAGTPGGAVSGA